MRFSIRSLKNYDVRCPNIDDFVNGIKIVRINFLKIDTEGMDHQIHKGAVDMLKGKRIDVVQFEYGMVSVETKFILKDFFQFFENYGYVVGKIYPTYVDFRQYHRSMEDFIGPNFLAVRSD